MATKYEIKKFLRNKKDEAIVNIRLEYKKKVEQSKQKFLADHRDEINAVGAKLEEAECKFEMLEANAVFKSEYYSNPKHFIDEALKKLSDEKITDFFDIPEMKKSVRWGEKTIEEAEREYERLIAVTQNMSAKDGLALLKNLGFDTAELETEKEVTALTINIDANKLFI